jgi:hypothetical protein
VHGAGCRMTDPKGRVVDADLMSDGSEGFDPYRIQWFLYNGDKCHLSTDRLLVAYR